VVRDRKTIFNNPSKYLLDQIKEENSDEEKLDAEVTNEIQNL